MPAKSSDSDTGKSYKTKVKKTTARKKATSKKSAPKKAMSRKKQAVKKTAIKKSTTRKRDLAAEIISAEERHAMIAIRAYYQAESRGFESGSEWDNWLQAEREIDAMLGQTK